MLYHNEAQVLKALEIESWRNLSKEKFIRFLAMMPEVDKEVALKLISQLPEFTKFARAALEEAKEAHTTTLAANDRSMEMAHQVGMERIAIMRAELDKELSTEERLRVLDGIRDAHERALAKDSENKRFLGEQFTKIVVATLTAVALGLVFVGAKVAFQGGGGRAIKA